MVWHVTFVLLKATSTEKRRVELTMTVSKRRVHDMVIPLEGLCKLLPLKPEIALEKDNTSHKRRRTR